MKLLKIDDNQGLFLNKDNEFDPIHLIDKDDLLRLAGLVLEEDHIELEPYDEHAIKNLAHKIIYKNIFEKLQGLRDRREDFMEKCNKLYRKAYDEYQEDSSTKLTGADPSNSTA